MTPRASSPGRWTSSSASCSGIWKPSCGPWNSQARLPLPRTAQASEPPRISAADVAAAFGRRRPFRNRCERLKPALLVLARATGIGGIAPLGGRDRGHLAAPPQRKEAVEALGAELPQRLQVLELTPVAARDRARELDADRRRVDRPPRRRGEAEQHELAGSQRGIGLELRQPEVHALGVGVEAGAQLRGQLAEHAPQLGQRVVVAAGRDVVGQAPCAEHLGQPALGGAPEQLELHEPVLRHRVADADPQVVVVARAHVRHAVGVARDRRAGDRLRGGGRLVEAGGLEGEGLEQGHLVVQVRVRPALRDVAGLPGRQHRLGLDDARGGGDRHREECRDGGDDDPFHGAERYPGYCSRA